MKERSHDDAMAEMFKEDPAFAIEYLAHLVKYGETSDISIALRQMKQANDNCNS